MHWAYYLLMVFVLFAGLAMNIVGLPGLWLMIAGYAGFAWLTGWEHYIGWPSTITMLVLALAAEGVEFAAGAAGSKAAGARKRGMIGAVIGGVLGAIFLSIIPVIVVAQVVGACLGAFIGAAVAEFWDRDAAHSIRVGIGAAKGRFWGIVTKLAFGIVMLIVGIFAGLPIGAAPAPAAPISPTLPPTTFPATVPATTQAI